MKTCRLLVTLLLVAVAARAALAGDRIVVVGQNLQNFFYSLDCGRTQGNSVGKSNYTTEAGRTAKLNAVVQTLAQYDADICAFNEVECCEEVMLLLAQRMSEHTGRTYRPVADGLTYDKAANPDGVIKSGFIYNAATVEPVGDNLTTAVGYTYVYPAMMRMQTFRSKASGEAFTLSMNHFKASTSADVSEDVEKREQNAQALLKGLDQATLDPDILVMGDLNSTVGERCLDNLLDAGFEEQILRYHPADYSHWYDNAGSLIDHVYANASMAAQVADAGVRYVANKHSVGTYNAYSDHDPYVVTLQLESQPATTYSYRRVTGISSGHHYLLVANDTQAADPVPPTSTYGYQAATTVTPVSDVIAMPTLRNGFYFEDAGNGLYYIHDSYGRYLYSYSNGSSYSYSTNAGLRREAHTYRVTTNADGTFQIYNPVSGYRLLYQTASDNFSWRSWTSLRDGQYWPSLWEYDPTISTTGIADVPHDSQSAATTTRKVVQRGRLLIVAPNGRCYNMQGVEMW